MSSKWKYADIPAQTRLEMLKNGNKDLFDEEVARTKEVMEARREVGLDTDAQEKWIDDVGYNYNLHLATNAGESTDNVSKTGYSNVYYNKSGSSSGKAKIKANTGRSAYGLAKERIKDAADSASDEIRKKYTALKNQTAEEISEQSPILREMLINSGASLEGGRAKQLFSEMEDKLKAVYNEYDKAMNEEIAKSNKIYTEMINKLAQYRSDGVDDVTLYSTADALVKNLKQNGKVTYPSISSLSAKKTKDRDSEILPVNNTVKHEQNKAVQPEKEETTTQTEDIYSKSDVNTDKQETTSSILDAVSDLSIEKIKEAFIEMGLSAESANAILKRIGENAALRFVQ